MACPTTRRAVGVTAAGRRLLGLLALCVTFMGAAPASAQGGSMEYAVKAAYLYKFAPFVQWPPDAFASAASPFNLCVLGDDPFGASLDQAVRGQSVGEHPVIVRRLRVTEAATGCHILYVMDARRPASANALRSLHGAPVLTVSDQGHGDGTIIQFVVKDGHVRFSIDTGLAAANRVSISSKLLSLAVAGEPAK